jgi:hypothetical protein
MEDQSLVELVVMWPGRLLSSDDFGSSVERTATLHPLWQDERAEQRLVAGKGLKADWGELAKGATCGGEIAVLLRTSFRQQTGAM